MIVDVHGLELFGRHGVNDDERREGQAFLFDVTLEIDEPATEALRAELRASRTAGSLTDYFAGRPLPSVSTPTSVAGNRELGIV